MMLLPWSSTSSLVTALVGQLILQLCIRVVFIQAGTFSNTSIPPTPVPELTTLLLFGTGVAAMTSVRRRYRR
jgi:hypothetical protein